MTSGELASQPAHVLARLVREGAVSPVEIIEDTLAKAQVLQHRLNAFVVLDREGALRAAREAEASVRRGDALGPLHGVPVTIKDVAAVTGFATRKGSAVSDATPASGDAVTVTRLRTAGAIVIGKTTMPEQGWIAASDSPLTGATYNPWKAGFTAGGSSSGAAALAAAGCAPLHLGSDGAGSVRLPAHFCGVVGLKPTFGLLPYTPTPNNNALSHIGPIARSVADAELMLEVMAGAHALDATTQALGYRRGRAGEGVRGLRIAFSPDLGHAKVDPDIAACVAKAAKAFEGLGAQVELVTPQWGPKGPELGRMLWGAWLAPFAPKDALTASKMDVGFLACIEAFADLAWADVQAALGRRLAYAAEVGRWFEDGWDLLLTPAASVAAFPTGRIAPAHWEAHAWDWLRWAEFSYPFNLAHGPAVSVPCGMTAEGLPIGLQIAGPRFADGLVMRAGDAFLEACPFVYPDALGAP